MNKAAATSLALTLGLAGTYALREYGGFGGPAEPENGPAERPKSGPAGPTGRSIPEPTGGEANAGPEIRPDEIDIAATLVPLDAFCYLRIDSLGQLEEFVQEALEEIDPAMARSIDARGMLQMMLGSLGGDAALVDWQRPMGLALSMPGGAAQPVATMIVPVTSAKRFADALTLPPGFATPQAREDYVGVAMGPNYRLGSKPADIALDLPRGRIAARIHFDPIRTLIDQGVQQVRQMDPQQLGMSAADAHFYRAGQDLAIDFYADIEELEFGFDWGTAGTEMTLGTVFSDGSPFAMPSTQEPVAAATMARMLGGGEDFVFASTWGPEFLDGPLRNVFERCVELGGTDANESAIERARTMLALAPMIGRQFLAFGDLEVGSAHAGLVLRPPVVGPILDTLVAQIEGSPLGLLLVEPPTEHELEGGRDLRMRFHLDVPEDGGWSPEDARALEGLSMLCGSDEIELRLISRGGDLAILLGGDEAWLDASSRRVGAEGEVEVDSRLAGPFSTLAGGSPTYLYRVDVLACMREMVRLTAAHMDLDPSEDLMRLERAVGSDPLEVLSYGAADGRRWTATVHMDWTRLGLLGRAIGG